METTYAGDLATLKERLQQAGAPLHAEALQRIQQLERLCAMMTDTGVILEEDAAALGQADTWWLPHDSEYCYANLQEAMDDVTTPGTVVRWGRAHTLPDCWAVALTEVRDTTGRVVVHAGVQEFATEAEAEEAAADYQLRKRRQEYQA